MALTVDADDLVSHTVTSTWTGNFSPRPPPRLLTTTELAMPLEVILIVLLVLALFKPKEVTFEL